MLEQEQLLTSSRPRPWIRFWARSFDMYVFSLIIDFLLPFNTMTLTWIENTILTIAITFLWSIAEGACFAYFGTTLGKEVLGIRIYNRYGHKLTQYDSFRRSRLVWWRGIGTGLGPPMLIAHIVGYNKLVKYGRTTWDRDMDNIVVHEEVGLMRGIMFAACFLIMIGLSMHSYI